MSNSTNTKRLAEEEKRSDDYKSDNKESWLNEHGYPSYEFLQSLSRDGDIEKLKSIAEDMDVEYGSGDTAKDLFQAIASATSDDPTS